MQRCSLEEFAEAPAGRFVAGARFVHFCAAPELWGLVLWGRADEADVDQIWRSLALEFRAPSVPHGALIDASRLDGSDAGPFARVERFLSKYASPLSEFILRLAIVRPGGFAGAVVVGARSVLPFSFPVSVFEEIEPAICWLQPVAPAVAPRDLVDGLALAQEQASGIPPFLAALRGHLEAHPDRASLEAGARAVAMSQRSLQRKLLEAETSWQEEVARARVKVARRMLEHGSLPLTEIAMAVGCSSLPHFSALFKRVTGTTPGACRRKATRAP